jgi:hypothetical protein
MVPPGDATDLPREGPATDWFPASSDTFCGAAMGPSPRTSSPRSLATGTVAENIVTEIVDHRLSPRTQSPRSLATGTVAENIVTEIVDHRLSPLPLIDRQRPTGGPLTFEARLRP